MRKQFVVTFALALLVAGCQDSSSSASKDPKPAPLDPSKSQVSGNPGAAPVEYLGVIAKGKKNAEARTAIAEFDKAIQMFEAMEGSKPKTLDDLVKKGHLTKMPKVPYGMKFNYDPKTGKVTAGMAK
ncbi:MAG: hypothetical protein ACI8QF_004655 [Limisphaerales bacterium]|jgi:hypothetical protein